jgi:hypothetical protein
MSYRVGDAVIYKGEVYYIIDGPIMGTEGGIFHISKVPPPIRVLEHELRPAPESKT